MKRIFDRGKMMAAAVVLAGALGGAGCLFVAGAGAAAGTVAYFQGDLRGNLPTGLEGATGAARAAVSDLGFHLIEEKVDGLTASWVVRTADDRKVTIRMEEAGPRSTDISIRVGLFGDERLSTRIHAAIRERI